MKKKITALLLVMAMIATVLPFSAFAAEGQSQYGSGLDDGATYALKVPTDITNFGQAYQWSNGGYNLTIRQEDGESFIEYGEKAMEYFEGDWNTSIYAAGTTYGGDIAKKNTYAGGVPSTEDISNTKYIAWRIKINDNNPVGSYTVSRFKPYISCGGQYGLHGTTSAVPAYFYDLTDGSYNAWYGNNGFWKATEGAFSVVGDIDGYLITPYAVNSNVTAEKIASSYTNLQIFFCECDAVTSGDNQRKASDWDNKEFLLGDCFFIEDIDKFVDARNAANGIVQYSSNKGDSAWIANKVNGATRNTVRGWAWSSAKSFCDPTLETATNSYTYAHVAKMSDTEVGVVFANNAGYTSGGNRSVSLNGTYPTSHNTSEKFQGTDGIPAAIDLDKMTYLAQRVIFKGTEANPINGQGFRLYLNNSSQKHLSSSAQVILIEDGVAKSVTYNGGLDFFADFDGWILAPMSGWGDSYWDDAHTTWSGGFQFFADGDWSEKTLIIGNMYFVENVATFCGKYSAPKLAASAGKDYIKIQNVIDGVVYSVDGTNWSSTGLFEGLEKGVEYTVSAKFAGSNNVTQIKLWTDLYSTHVGDTANYYMSVPDYETSIKYGSGLGWSSSWFWRNPADTAYQPDNNSGNAHVFVKEVDGETFIDLTLNPENAETATMPFCPNLVMAPNKLTFGTDLFSGEYDVEAVTHFAMRFKLEGLAEGKSAKLGILAEPFYFLDMSGAYLVDYDTREVTDPGWTGESIIFEKNFNGWIVFPLEDMGDDTSKTITYTDPSSGEEASYTITFKEALFNQVTPKNGEKNAISSFQFWFHNDDESNNDGVGNEGCSHWVGNSDWRGTTLYMGDMVAIENAETFNKVRTSCDVLGHEFELLDKLDPTCTEGGYTTYVCALCSYIEDQDFVEALGHDLVYSGTQPTCTEGGYIYEKCNVCDYEFEGAKEALGHDFTLTVIKPTQFEDGYTLHECERCGYSYKDDYVDAAADDTVRIMFYAFSGWAKSYTTDGVNTTEDQLREIEDVLAQGYVNTISMGTGEGFEERIALCRKYNVKFWMGLEKFYSETQTLENYINNAEASVQKVIDAGAWDLFLGFHWDEPIWGGMSNEDFYDMTKALYEKWGKRNYPVFAGGAFVDGYNSTCDKISAEYLTYVTDAGWDSYSYDVQDSALTNAKQNAQLAKSSSTFGVTLNTAKDLYRFWQSELAEKFDHNVNFWFYPCAYYHYTWTGGYSDENYNIAHINFFNQLLQEQTYKGGLALYTYATYSETSAPGLNQYLPVPNIATGEQLLYPNVAKWNTYAARIKELKKQYDNTPINFDANLNFGSLYVTDLTDNSITINPLDGYVYSIDGGKTFTTEKTFSNLAPDTAYTIRVKRLKDGKTKDFVVRTEKTDRYASGLNDTASYMLDLPENVERVTNKYGWIAATNSRNEDDTAFTGDNNGSIFLKTVNGERFLEIKNSGGDAPTSIDLSLGDQTRAKSEKGIPEEIDTTKIQYIAFRMKTKGGSASQISTFDVYIGSKRLGNTSSFPVKFVDFNTLKVSDVNYVGGMQFVGEVDGWVIIPIEAYASFGEAANIMWMEKNITSIQIWQHVDGCSHNATGSSWTNRTLFFGDMFWLEDLDRFVQARTAPTAPTTSLVCKDRITVNAQDGVVYSIDGGKTWSQDGVFTGLSGATTYTVLAKYEFGTDTASLSVTTPSNHAYRGKITRPTCTEQGYTIFTCSTCGDSYKGNVRPATGHSYGDGVVTAPTCDTAGFTTYTCSVCGGTEIKDEVEALGHSYVSTVVPPTETEQGYTEHTCSVCGDSYKDNYKDPVDPSAPTNKVSGVVVTPSDVDVTVTWDSFEGADRYLVRALNPDGTTFNTQTITDGSNKAVFKGFEYDTEYTFYVIARVGGKYQSVDDADKIASGLVIGDRVVGIKSSVKGRTITVSWMEYPNATNYYVMVYPKGADPTVNANRVTTVNAGNNTTANIINVIAPETDYEIYVSARVNGKYQSLENALYTSAIIPVTAPSSFEITSIEPTIVRIKWNAVKNADRYWARLVDEKGNTVKTRECAKALVSFTGLTPGKTYYVQLQARVPKSSGGNQYSGYCDPILTQPVTLPLK